MYEVLHVFPERFDGGHQYSAGDTYPREGFTPPAGRVEALASGVRGPMNRTGKVYIKPQEEPKAPKAPKVAPKPKSTKKTEE